MSAFDDKMSAAMGAVRSTFGESVTYTDGDGVDTEIADATFARDDPALHPVSDGETTVHSAVATIPKTSLAAVAAGETVTIGGETWTVDNFRSVGGGDSWELNLRRSEHRDKSRESYRIRR